MRFMTVVAHQGVFPIGGTVDGVDQMLAHKDPSNELPSGVMVAVNDEKEATVTTYGGFHRDHTMRVVSVMGRACWYAASGFK